MRKFSAFGRVSTEDSRDYSEFFCLATKEKNQKTEQNKTQVHKPRTQQQQQQQHQV